MQWDVVKTAGDVPPSRMHHTATVIGNEMFVCGGIGHDEQVLADLWSLDLSSLLWKRIPAGGKLLSHHSAVVLEPSKVYLIITGRWHDSNRFWRI